MMYDFGLLHCQCIGSGLHPRSRLELGCPEQFSISPDDYWQWLVMFQDGTLQRVSIEGYCIHAKVVPRALDGQLRLGCKQ